MKQEDRPVTWLQFNNVFPIIVSAVMIAGSFYGLSTKLEVLISKVENLIATTQENSKTAQALMARISAQETRLTRIETKLGL